VTTRECIQAFSISSYAVSVAKWDCTLPLRRRGWCETCMSGMWESLRTRLVGGGETKPSKAQPSSICSAANVLVITCTGKIAANQRSSSTNRSNELLAKFPLTVHRLMSMRAAGCWTHKCVSLSPLSSRCDCCFYLFS
jgi:hypothetical protein